MSVDEWNGKFYLSPNGNIFAIAQMTMFKINRNPTNMSQKVFETTRSLPDMRQNSASLSRPVT